jgi:hypothetical protein
MSKWILMAVVAGVLSNGYVRADDEKKEEPKKEEKKEEPKKEETK